MSHRDDETMNELMNGFMNGFMNRFDETALKAEWTHDGHVAEDSVYAWLDGALDPTESEAVQAHVSTCTACANAVAEARGYIAASLRIMHAADVTPRRTLSQVDATSVAHIVAHANNVSAPTVQRRVDVPLTIPRTAPRKTAWHNSTVMRAAALLLLAVGVYGVMRDGSQPTTLRVQQPVAQSDAKANAESAAVKTPSPLPVAVNARASTRSATNAAAGASRSAPTAASNVASNIASNVASPPAAPPRTAPAERQGRTASAQQPGPQPLPRVIVEAPIPEPVRIPFSSTVASVANVDSAGQRTLKGFVRDFDGNPIGSAIVRVAGTEVQTISANDGSFTINNPPAGGVVQVRRIGYDNTELRVDSASARPIDVQLKRSVLSLQTFVTSSLSGKVAGVPIERCMESRLTLPTVASSNTRSAYEPLVRAMRVREPYDQKNNVTLEGWPRPGSNTRLTVTEDADGVFSGRARARGANLDVHLIPEGDEWIATLREYRGANVRSENLLYHETSTNKCK
ncbi:MAG: carboxypeptidase regulatory-like domain-containing protein [Gemmatimonas sp.]